MQVGLPITFPQVFYSQNIFISVVWSFMKTEVVYKSFLCETCSADPLGLTFAAKLLNAKRSN